MNIMPINRCTLHRLDSFLGHLGKHELRLWQADPMNMDFLKWWEFRSNLNPSARLKLPYTLYIYMHGCRQYIVFRNNCSNIPVAELNNIQYLGNTNMQRLNLPFFLFPLLDYVSMYSWLRSSEMLLFVFVFICSFFIVLWLIRPDSSSESMPIVQRMSSSCPTLSKNILKTCAFAP